MDTIQEIAHGDLQQYAVQLQEALESVCASPAFRTSPKSCEFLRHVVHQTLLGKTNELKERLIGILLLGRDTSYDTVSDAGVRVRANEVRKRLLAYQRNHPDQCAFSFELQPGSYVPHFFRHLAEAPVRTVPDQISVPKSIAAAQPLSYQQLAAPVLVALFLCAICLRWQIAQEHSFAQFWQSVFEDRHATLYIPSTFSDREQPVAAMQELRTVAPLLNVAEDFHTRLNLVSATEPSEPVSAIVLESASGSTGNGQIPTAGEARLTFATTAHGREMLDRSAPGSHRFAGRAALLTIANGTPRSIQIDGSDNAAIESLVEMLSDKGRFPDHLADSLQKGTITQIVFPLDAHADTVTFHEPLSSAETGEVRTP